MNPTSQGWLDAAQDDLRLIKAIISDEQLTHLAAFHAQQCIEKSLKARIESRQETVPKIHSLNRLFQLAGVEIEEGESDLVNMLDELYIESRYPGELGLLPGGKPTLEDAEEFFAFAQRIYGMILGELKT